MAESRLAQSTSQPVVSNARDLFGFVRASFRASDLRVESGAVDVDLVGVDEVAAVVGGAVDRSALRRRRYHEDVLAALAFEASLVPVEPGASFRNLEEARRFLRRHRSVVLDEIERLGDAVEFGVRVVWNVDDCFDFLTARHASLADVRSEVEGGEGAVRISRQYDRALRRERRKFGDALGRELRGACRELCSRPCRREAELAEVRCLVGQKRARGFEREVYEFAEALAAEVTVECSHPGAPKSFVDAALAKRVAARC